MKNYSSLVRPLTELTRKGVDFKWTAACDEAFHALKQALIGTDIMAYPKETGLFILDTDASDYQVAGILSQVQDVGWLVGCFGFNGSLRQYFSLYRAISQREGERKEKR